MRGKHLCGLHQVCLDRITPAHAGKTVVAVDVGSAVGDHPRACGENPVYFYEINIVAGSPPRMRGKHGRGEHRARQERITPAHAGKTSMSKNFQELSEDHPRACGENSGISFPPHRGRGSPPRMRGKLSCSPSAFWFVGITPAHAGKTRKVEASALSNRDHPRACGENWASGIVSFNGPGSPPRMRGKLRT